VYDYSPLTQPDVLNNILLQSVAKRKSRLRKNHTFSPLSSTVSGWATTGIIANGQCPAQSPQSCVRGHLSGVGRGLVRPQARNRVLDLLPSRSSTFSDVWNAYQLYDDAFFDQRAPFPKIWVWLRAGQLNETTPSADYLGILLLDRSERCSRTILGCSRRRQVESLRGILRISIVGA